MRTLTATSLMSLSSSVLLGVVGATIMFVGTHQILAGTLSLGGFFTYNMLLAFLVAPIIQLSPSAPSSPKRLPAWSALMRFSASSPKIAIPEERILPEILGDVSFDRVSFSYDGKRTVLHDISFRQSMVRSPPWSVLPDRANQPSSD